MTVAEVDCLFESMDSVLDLLSQLEESEWQVQSLCPAWRVHQVRSEQSAPLGPTLDTTTFPSTDRSH